ncbi:hypothetical protein BT69DRAFT_42038 [Atractiella rhizophila]|nr:hypothetical protein BT69DRAFT_42038 [Atractiella rhizophila]
MPHSISDIDSMQDIPPSRFETTTSSPSASDTITSIPPEIITAILACLPTLELLQCHLVCTAWKPLARPLLVSKTTIAFDCLADALADGTFLRYLSRLRRFFEFQPNFRYVRRISVSASSLTYNELLWKEKGSENDEKEDRERNLDRDGKSNILASNYVRSFIETASPYITSLTFNAPFDTWEFWPMWTFPSLPALTNITIYYIPAQSISDTFPNLGTSCHLKSLKCTFGTANLDSTEQSFELRSLSLIHAYAPTKPPILSNLMDLYLQPAAQTPSELGNVANLLRLASSTVQTLDLVLPHVPDGSRHLIFRLFNSNTRHFGSIAFTATFPIHGNYFHGI